MWSHVISTRTLHCWTVLTHCPMEHCHKAQHAAQIRVKTVRGKSGRWIQVPNLHQIRIQSPGWRAPMSRLGVDNLCGLLSNKWLGGERSNLTKHTSPNWLLLSNHDNSPNWLLLSNHDKIPSPTHTQDCSLTSGHSFQNSVIVNFNTFLTYIFKLCNRTTVKHWS